MSAWANEAQPQTSEVKAEPAGVVVSPVELNQVKPLAFEVKPTDVNLRGVLDRWSRASGWLFEAQHWALPRDIPMAGQAAFEGEDFRMAVRWLMRSTLQTDLPAQACFYSNRVVRVISMQESCVRITRQE